MESFLICYDIRATLPNADPHRHFHSAVSQEGYLGESERVFTKSDSAKSGDSESTQTLYSELEWPAVWQRDNLDTDTG